MSTTTTDTTIQATTRRRGRPPAISSPSSPPRRRWLTVREVADYLGICIQSVWRGVREGRLPEPAYPTAANARWDLEELDRAMQALKGSPRDAMASRRAARIAQNDNGSAEAA